MVWAGELGGRWGRRVIAAARFAIAVALIHAVATAAVAQPSSGDFFAPPPSSGGFDPAAALSATGAAAADRNSADAAFTGLAERPQVDAMLGQATTSVPIIVPPGRKGMAPQIGLTYGSRGVNGLIGRGWDLRVPRVERSTRYGVPVDWTNTALPYRDDAFALIMPSGTVQLDRFLGNSGSNRVYGSSHEEAMLRVWFTPTNNSWTVTDTSGVRYEFGVGATNHAARVGDDVSQDDYTFAWALTKIVDPSGNSISYSYAAYGVSGTSNAALYPSRIDYGANATAGYADLFHVCFAYDATGATCTGTPVARPDPVVSHAGGFSADVAHRVSGIKVWADGESTEADPTRRYVLTYVQDPISFESRLQRVDLHAGALSLPATTFTYNNASQLMLNTTAPQFFASGSPRTQLSLRRNTLQAGTRSDLVDMTGDGRPDWVECDGETVNNNWFVHPNLGNGQFGARQTWTGPQCGMHGYHYELMDMNGDALPDFVFTNIPSPGGTSRDWDIWYNTGSGFSAEHTWSVPPPAAGTTNYGIWPNPLNGAGGTRDLNGDALPDAVDTYCNCNINGVESYCLGEEGLCRVYLGTGDGFDDPGTLWSWPRIYGLPGHTNSFNTHLGRTLYALQDLNGDGLPELVMSRPPLDPRSSATGECFGGNNGTACTSDTACGVGTCTDPTAWGVFVNTGTGFAFESVCSGGSRDGLSCAGGCPSGRCEDIPAEYWTAPVDAFAERMDLEQACGHSNTDLAGWPPIGLQGALRDMNGDGLPDYVDSNVDCDAPQAGPGWRVFINSGTDFSPTPVTWNGTAGILVQEWRAQDDIVSVPVDVSVVAADTMDFNGDGVPDHVSAPTSPTSRIDVRWGFGQPPGTLSKQENGLGASIEITYGLASAVSPAPGPSALMCSSGAADGKPCKFGSDCGTGTCAACTDCDHTPFALNAVSQIVARSGRTGTGHTLTKTYRYLAPYYDWEEREFRGFRWAIEEDSARGRRTETEFVQPGANPRTQVTHCGAPTQTCTDLAAARPFKGKSRGGRVRSSGSAKVHAESASTWEAVTVNDPRVSGPQSIAVRLSEQSSTAWGSTTSTSLTNRRELDQDPYNNVTEERRYDGATQVSRTVATFAPGASTWIVDRPASIEVRDSQGALLSRREYTYTAAGNLQTAKRFLADDPIGPDGVTVTVATVGYSGSAGLAGQPTSITDARSNPTTLAYTASGCDTQGLYPCAVTNALGQTAQRRHSLEFGAVTEDRDVNDARTALQYDDLGRLIRITRGIASGALPATLLPWREFTYSLGSPGTPATPSRVQTRIREPGHATDFRIENRFFDGLGRFLESKTEAIVGGSAQIVRGEAVGFDAAGRVIQQYVPATTTGAVDAYELPSGALTATAFDLLDRPSQVTRPDGNVRTTLYDPAGTVDLRDENYIACNGLPGSVLNASCPGKRTVEERDALGRVRAVKVYAGATLDTHTVNEYDGLDRTTSTKLAADEDSKVTYTYDSFDRRVQLSEKNSGIWRYGYDYAGNLVYQDDPNGSQHLERCFDALNRPTAKRAFASDAYSGNHCGSGGELRATNTYDACTHGVGRLCQQNSPDRYLLTRAYTARGQVVNESRTVTATGLTRTVTQGFSYDEADRLKTVTYPSSLEGISELLTNGYDAGGHLASAATSANVYLSSALYDVFGRATRLDLATGAGAVAEQRDYFDVTGNFRLKQIAAIRGVTALQTWNYGPTAGGTISSGYDRAGNLLRIDDVTPASQYADNSERDNDWQYTYDGLGRLTGAAWDARTTAAAFAYADNLGNMTAGNLAFPDFSATTAATFTHDPSRPHQVDWSNPPGSSTAYAYETTGSNGDGNGSLTSRPATFPGDTAKSIAYDKEGRVVSVTAGGNVTESIYDDDGMRVARIVNGTDVTLFFGRFVELRAGVLTRHVYAGDRRIAASAVVAPPDLTLAAADDPERVMLARAAADAEWLRGLPPIGPGGHVVAAVAGAAVLIGGTLLLLVVPVGRARVGVIGTVRRGRVAALVLLYVVALPAWPPRPKHPIAPPPAAADCPLTDPQPARMVFADHLGSTTLMTRYSDGAALQYFRYGPYGAPQAYTPGGARVASGSEFTELTYTGQRWDAFAQIFYYRARYYDPRVARFTAPDGLRQFANPYTYVNSRPIGYVDPSGLLTVPNAGVAAGLNFHYYVFGDHANDGVTRERGQKDQIRPPKNYAPGADLDDDAWLPEVAGFGEGPLGFTSTSKAESDAAYANGFVALLAGANAYNSYFELTKQLDSAIPGLTTFIPPSAQPPNGSPQLWLSAAVELIQYASTIPFLPQGVAVTLDTIAWGTTGDQINAAIDAGTVSSLQGQALHVLNGSILVAGVGTSSSLTPPQASLAASAYGLTGFYVIGYNIGFGPVAQGVIDGTRW